MANEIRTWSEEEFLEGAEERIEQELGIWRDIFKEIAARHEKYDAAMVRNYLRKENLALHDVCFLFEAGDCVLLRSRVPGKLATKVLGPFIFVNYTGALQVTATIAGLDGSRRIVSAANLLPMHPAAHTPLAPKNDDGDSDDLAISESEGDDIVVAEDHSVVAPVANRICKRQRGE